MYVFVLIGQFIITRSELENREGQGIWDIDHLSVNETSQDAGLLLMEVTMSLQ